MANCCVCGGEGPMVVIHSDCLHDLLELVHEQQAPLCVLCANVALCMQERSGVDCRHVFRLDQAKALAALEKREEASEE